MSFRNDPRASWEATGRRGVTRRVIVGYGQLRKFQAVHAGEVDWGLNVDPLQTERLLLRFPIMSDLEALLERRNDPVVAKYQDWPLPYEPESAKQLLAGASTMQSPTRGQWCMLTAVDRDREMGAPLGDLAVHLSEDGREAEIGYTFATSNHGRGYATEAVEALLEHLFRRMGVTRVSASLHPDNVASAMLLERTGFIYEGRIQHSYWRGEGANAVYSDALFYGLTEHDRGRWQERPTKPPEDVRLVEVTADNQRDVSKLVTHKSQERLVTPVQQSFADALFPEDFNDVPVVPWLRAIEADGELVGFVMVAWRTVHHPNPYLWRLLIDRMHQRRGIGNMALDLVEEACRRNGDAAIEVSWSEGRGSPAPFYEARGYVRTGNLVDGETEARKPLT